jgi:hypothetical protein
VGATAVSSEEGVVWGTENAQPVAVTCYSIETEPNVISIEFPGNIGQTKSITDIVNGLDGKLRLQLKEGAEYPSHLDVFGIKAKGYEEAVALVQAVGDPVVRRFNDKRPFVEIHFRNRVEIELTAPAP